MSALKYAGFWIRVGASVIDTLLIGVIIVPALTLIYGRDYWQGTEFVHGYWDLALNYVLPAIAVVLFWVYRSATPGKMALGLTIVDSKTGGKPSTGQLVGRYLGYYVSTVPLLLGLFWVGLDPKKQGWHDKLAGTVVVRRETDGVARFEG